MIFLVVMPLSAAFFNWIVPLQLGARDVAFPRLYAFSYWTFLFGGILLNLSWIFALPDSISLISFGLGLPLLWWAIQPSNKETNKYGPPR